jgi:hypothetical protein
VRANVAIRSSMPGRPCRRHRSGSPARNPELVFGVAVVKQRQLHSLGFDPTAAVALNLVYSAIGFGLFCWLAARWWMRRRRARTTASAAAHL